ncbi:type II toxin-antitoxin system Phd/YefM family antitoxin [Streptomyces thermocarboxydus]
MYAQHLPALRGRGMSTISVREFSYNPSAVFARVEKGEAIEVTRHGNVIAILSPAGSPMERYAHLVAQGKIKLKPVTAAERHSMPHYEVPEDVDPVALLLAEREEDDR